MKANKKNDKKTRKKRVCTNALLETNSFNCMLVILLYPPQSDFRQQISILLFLFVNNTQIMILFLALLVFTSVSFILFRVIVVLNFKSTHRTKPSFGLFSSWPKNTNRNHFVEMSTAIKVK